jgi:hypothetical protein
MGVAQNAIDPLSGITPSSRIRRIAVHFRAPSSGICRQLDFRAAGLPMSRLPTVALEMHVVTYNIWESHFRRLRSKALSNFVTFTLLATALIVVGSR